MFRQQLAECAHELTSRVNLQKSSLSERPALVDATKRSGNLGCTLISQRLSFFVAGSDVNHGQRKLSNGQCGGRSDRVEDTKDQPDGLH